MASGLPGPQPHNTSRYRGTMVKMNGKGIAPYLYRPISTWRYRLPDMAAWFLCNEQITGLNLMTYPTLGEDCSSDGVRVSKNEAHAHPAKNLLEISGLSLGRRAPGRIGMPTTQQFKVLSFSPENKQQQSVHDLGTEGTTGEYLHDAHHNGNKLNYGTSLHGKLDAL
ncbi:unnamed protein product [Nesidiocoris tenuis]|uniref:Uncharacterized protein n=1 Tax=Nesidiocoris tenuis TaxID=355587 RepID=A0A6H5GUX5_9HEMI|nr:unnamed protein product [Nesidiocoris tenuis]